jgi:hypothetical protein
VPAATLNRKVWPPLINRPQSLRGGDNPMTIAP